MKLIFLHGLGQTADSWKSIATQFTDQEVTCLELFENGRLPHKLSEITNQIQHIIVESKEDVVVIGLSLGGMLALSLLENPAQNLKGLVVCAGQYQFKHNIAYRFQTMLFRLFPSTFFKKHGMDKENVLSFYKGMADFDLTETLRKTRIPCQLICGDKDKINLKTSKELLTLIPNAEFTILKNTGHESNIENPIGLAQVISDFLESKLIK